MQSRRVHIRPSMPVAGFPLTRILIITDAWLPQMNGVVRSIEALVREAPTLGVEIEILAANEFCTVPLPTYPQVRVAVTGPGEVRRRIEQFGSARFYFPLGVALRRVAPSSLYTASSVPQCWLGERRKRAGLVV